MNKREKLAREMMLNAERLHGSERGRELLGFDTLEAFIDSGWRNYLPFVDIALAFEAQPSVNLETVNRALSATVQKQETELKALRQANKAAYSWLDGWGAHARSCAGGQQCTCGLTAVKFELIQSVAADYDQL